MTVLNKVMYCGRYHETKSLIGEPKGSTLLIPKTVIGLDPEPVHRSQIHLNVILHFLGITGRLVSIRICC
jgi:hypothetical protein